MYLHTYRRIYSFPLAIAAAAGAAAINIECISGH